MTSLNIFKKKILFAWIVIFPMAVAILYYTFFAMDRYVSVAQVVVRQPGNESSKLSVPSIALMMSGINPASREETLYLREYIMSIDMLNVLESELNWHEHFSKQWRDPLFWVGKDVPREELLEYYNRLVDAQFDETTGLLTVEVQALDPEFSQQVLKLILSRSEAFVNEISHRMARDQMKFAETELELARKKYEDEKRVMLEFQSRSEHLNAQAAAESRANIIATLEAELTTQRAALNGLLSTLNPNTPQVRQQKARIGALEQQLAAEKRTLLSSAQGDKLNVVAARYRDLAIDVGIAEEAYKASIVAVENARIEIAKKIRSLVTVVSPNLPQSAIYPERIYNLFTLFVALLLVYGVARFVIATIEDHRD